MNKEIKEEWLVLATLFNLPSKWFVNDFIDIFTNTVLDIPKYDNGIYVVFKGINHLRNEEFNLNSNMYYIYYYNINNTIYTIYFIKSNNDTKIELDLLKTLGSKALSKDLICNIAIHFNKYIGNTFNNILNVVTFTKILNKESLGMIPQAFILF